MGRTIPQGEEKEKNDFSDFVEDVGQLRFLAGVQPLIHVVEGRGSTRLTH